MAKSETLVEQMQKDAYNGSINDLVEEKHRLNGRKMMASTYLQRARRRIARDLANYHHKPSAVQSTAMS